MSARSFAVTALRVWAVFMLAGCVLGLTTAIAQWMLPVADETPQWRIASTWTFVQQLLAAITAIALLKFSQPLALRLTADIDHSDTTSPEVSLEAIAFGCLALYFVLEGLRSCGGLVFQLATKPQYEQEQFAYLWRDSPRELVSAIVQTIAGILLFIGRHKLTTIWRALRPYQARN